MRMFRGLLDRHDLTFRIVFFLLMLSLSVIFLFVGTRAALAVGIKQNSIITGETIMLDDVFYNLPAGKNTVLGPAPRPGHDMTLNARTLLRIAVAMDLPWRPQSTADYVVLSRAATVIEKNAVEEDLRTALKEKGLDGSFNLLFSGAPPEIILPPEQQPSFEITNVTYDPQREWFTATISAPSSVNPIQHLQVSGSIERMAQIPVPRENLRNGIIIGKYDIDTIEIPQRSLNANMIIKPETLMGMTPRRMLLAGKPVLATEVEAPRIVSRGDYVTMIFNEGALTLTAKGKALENGAKGDLVRVSNSSSNRTIEGVVTGEKEVTIQSY